MRRRRLVFSDASIADILEQAEWYAAQSGQPLAQRWQKAVTTAMSRLLTGTPLARPADFDRQHFAM
jgi:plasmid stabilization system protein ParE